MNWISYGLFITSLPQLLEFLPASTAKAAQDSISANVGPRATLALFMLGIFLAAFLAWKRLDDQRADHLDPHTLSALSAQFTQSGDLFDKGRLGDCAIDKWSVDFNAWYAATYEMIKTHVSATDAALFREPEGGSTIGYYVGPGGRTHNQNLNMLRGYQQNLRRIIERHSGH